MYAKQVLTALAITLSAGAAMAIEATQFVPEPSTMTRAQVKAEMQQARSEHTMLIGGEATEFIGPAVASAPRDREEVRAEARVAAHEHKFNELYVGAA
jgi:hypothetical protein